MFSVIVMTFSFFCKTIFASSTVHSREEALRWITSLGSKSADWDGTGQIWCVDLTNYYFKYLFGYAPRGGNGGDYISGCAGCTSIPYYSGFIAQPGDIAVWNYGNYGTYGHVALVTDADNVAMVYTHIGGYNQPITHGNWIRYTSDIGNGQYFWGVLRPDFSDPINHNPIIAFDSLSSNTPRTITVTGWAYDPDDVTRSIDVHVYLFGQGDPIYLGATTANISRKDVDNAFHVGEFHGFAATFNVPTGGNLDIDVAAINIGEGDNYFYPDHKNVNVSSDVVMDVNFFVDGNDTLNLDGIGSIEVYVGDKVQTTNGSANYTDFCQHVPANQPYNIKVNITNSNYRYVGASSASGEGLTGNTGSGNEVRIVVCKNNGADRVLPDGNYMIAASGTSDKTTFYYLDIEGTEQPANNGTNVSLCGPSAGDVPSFEIWNLTYDNGFYWIKQMGTDTSLDVAGGTCIEDANIQVHKSNSSDAQKWKITRNGTNGYRLQAACSGMSLDIKGAAISNGTNVQQHRNNSSVAQSWLFIPYNPSQPIENGRYVLISGLDDHVEMDIPGDTGDIENNTNVAIWSDNAPSKYNSFDITALDNGYYSIIHAASGKSLDLSGGLPDYSSNIVLHYTNGSIAQQWAIIPAEDGYTIWPRCSGYTVDVEGANTANNTNVSQYPYMGSRNQIWKFVKAEYAVKYDANGGEKEPANQIKYYKTDLELIYENIERQGYKFMGWDENRNAIEPEYSAGSLFTKDADTILYAIWSQPHNVNFDIGYKEGENPESRSVFIGDPIGELPVVERTGYTFAGWYDGENLVEATSSCTGDMVLNAHWTANIYSVILDGNGGTINGDTSFEVTFEAPYGEISSVSRENYISQGWFTEDDEKIEATTIVTTASDHTLYAKWRGETKTLMLNPNGGELNVSDELEAEYGSPYGELPVPKKKGYKFLGWFTTPRSSTQVTAETICQGDQTVYAQWEEDPNWCDHEYEETAKTEPTCVKDGSATLVCNHCGDEKVEVLPATGIHEFGEWTTTKEPTETEAGTKVRKCNNCDETETGTIPELSHEHDWGEWTITKEATCKEKGTKERLCSGCDEKETEEIVLSDHTWSQEYTVDKAASCTEEGSESIHCLVCNSVKEGTSRIINKADHAWDNGVETTPATAIAEGVKTFTCSVCKTTKTEIIPKLEATQSSEATSSAATPSAVTPEPKAEDGTAVGNGASAKTAAEAIISVSSDEGPSGTSFALLQARVKKTTKSSIKIGWKAVPGTVEYIVFGAPCGSKYQELQRVKGTTFTQKKLKKAKSYKYMVMAVSSNDTVLATSKTLHIMTDGGKRGNYKSVTVNKKSVALAKKGKTFKIKAKAVPKSGKTVKAHRKLAYESSDPAVATVNKSGKIKAVSKGKCNVFVYAADGTFAKIAVTVKK